MVEITCPFCDMSWEDPDLQEVGDTQLIPDDAFECGYPLEEGECSREVDSPGERCWQHEDNDG